MSARNALWKYYEKQLETPEKIQRTRRNKKPEKEVEKQCLAWMRNQGWDVNVIEAKGGYNNAYGVLPVVSGFPDCCGNTDFGIAVFIEFKAPKRRSTLKEHQRAFILRKIKTNAFAMCTDSVDYLARTWEGWAVLQAQQSFALAQEFLIDSLPKQKLEKEDSELFPPEC